MTVLGWLGVANAFAQAPASSAPVDGDLGDLVTDRPDFTESSDVVARGAVQFETGISVENDRLGAARTRAVTVPSALLRIGLGRRTELRLGGDGFLSETVDGRRVSGVSDMEVAMKVRLLDQARVGIDVAVIPIVSLPSGSDAFSSGGVDPTVKLTWARTLPAGVGLTGNVNVASLSDEIGRFTQRAFSVSMGRDLVGGWGGYLEVYAFSPMSRGTATGTTVDFGVSRAVGANAQFDVEGGRGLTAAAPDWFVGAGFAIRGRAWRAR